MTCHGAPNRCFQREVTLRADVSLDDCACSGSDSAKIVPNIVVQLLSSPRIVSKSAAVSHSLLHRHLEARALVGICVEPELLCARSGGTSISWMSAEDGVSGCPTPKLPRVDVRLSRVETHAVFQLTVQLRVIDTDLLLY